MSRCEIAAKLAKVVDKEAEEAAFSGYIMDFHIAYNEYITHIQDHGCWRDE